MGREVRVKTLDWGRAEQAAPKTQLRGEQGLAGPPPSDRGSWRPREERRGLGEERQAMASDRAPPDPGVYSPSPSQHQAAPRSPGGQGRDTARLQDFLASGVFRRFRSLRSMGLKVFRLGLGTFSTYSSTRPRSLPDIWLRRSRSTPCQAS